jgi:hypothetical protein
MSLAFRRQLAQGLRSKGYEKIRRIRRVLGSSLPKLDLANEEHQDFVEKGMLTKPDLCNTPDTKTLTYHQFFASSKRYSERQQAYQKIVKFHVQS